MLSTLTPFVAQVSLENGIVLNFDVRALPSNLESPSPSRFTLAAHDGPASALDVSPHLKGCIVTGGNDKLVKVWNIQENEDTGKRNVSLVTSRDLGVVGVCIIVCLFAFSQNVYQGKVFSAVWSPDDPLTLAAAGSKAKLQIWDVGANVGVRKAFDSKLRKAGRALKEKEHGGGVIGVIDDDEEESADDAD